jgi:hypothetical protein
MAYRGMNSFVKILLWILVAMIPVGIISCVHLLIVQPDLALAVWNSRGTPLWPLGVIAG